MYDLFSDGVCVLDCKTNDCDGHCDVCPSFKEYLDERKYSKE
jgi:hypothetical protein